MNRRGHRDFWCTMWRWTTLPSSASVFPCQYHFTIFYTTIHFSTTDTIWVKYPQLIASIKHIRLSICLFNYPSIRSPVHLFIYLPPTHPPPPTYLPIYLLNYLCIYLSIYIIFIYRSNKLSYNNQFIYLLSINLYIYLLSINQSIYISINVSINLSTYQSIDVSISVSLFIPFSLSLPPVRTLQDQVRGSSTMSYLGFTVEIFQIVVK